MPAPAPPASCSSCAVSGLPVPSASLPALAMAPTAPRVFFFPTPLSTRAMSWWALALRVVLGNSGDPVSQDAAYILNFHLLGIAVEFLLGAVAWRVAHLPLHLSWRVLLVLAGLAGWWSLAVWFGEVGDAGVNGSLLKGQMGALAALCFAPMVAGTLGSSPPSASSDTHVDPRLSHPWHAAALWVGRLSYGVYLFHMAALQMVQPWRETLAQHGPLGHQGLAVLLTLLLAWVCYWLWEEPWRQLGRRKAAQFSATN